MMSPLRLGLLALPLLASGCKSPTVVRPHLPASYGSFRRIDNALLFSLPDSGGYLVNTQRLDTTKLPGILHMVFDGPSAPQRAVFILDNPKRPWSDVKALARIIRRANVEVFDAELSGHAPLKGFTIIEAPGVHVDSTHH